MSGTGPTELVLVRHGESVGNVAAAEAERNGADTIAVQTRDADTPLSVRGEDQARALGAWLGALPPDRAPQSVWCSPYVRAAQTAASALDASGLTVPVRYDERLRDRELGIIDRLTRAGVQRRFPEEDARRHLLGKMYYRPPGGESWADVAQRLRSVLGDLMLLEDGHRVLVVTHDATVMLLRYVLEGMTEAQLMAEVRRHGVRNASVTQLTRHDDLWRLDAFDVVDHLEVLEAPVTSHPGTDPRGE